MSNDVVSSASSGNIPIEQQIQLWIPEDLSKMSKAPDAVDQFWTPLDLSKLTDVGVPISFVDRCKRDPLVPIFSAATVGALGTGMYYSFVAKRTDKANKMMRARIGFQFLAVTALGYSCLRVLYKDNEPSA